MTDPCKAKSPAPEGTAAARGGDHPYVSIATEGGMALAGSPAEFGRFIADETEKWAKVIRAANIKAE
jgi:hypothetical protein